MPEGIALFLDAGLQMTCAVGQFSQLLFRGIQQHSPATTFALSLTRTDGRLRDIWHSVGSADNIVCNFPIVAWKQVIFRPLLSMAIARLRGKRVILILHEWGSLHWLRRLTYIPALLSANVIVMFSPLVQSELESERFIGRWANKSVLAPLPPNIDAAQGTAASALQLRLANARSDGRLIIGCFGSIYPGKQPQALLNITAALKRRGFNPLTVYVGSFIRGLDKVEEEFYNRITELDISNDVIVSGFVRSEPELFGLLSEVDVFCYPLEEGLSARRASILASIQSGRPIVATSPARADEFDHHRRYKQLIDNGLITLVPRDLDSDAFAEAVVSVAKMPTVGAPFDFQGWWDDVVVAIDQHLRRASQHVPSKNKAPEIVNFASPKRCVNGGSGPFG